MNEKQELEITEKEELEKKTGHHDKYQAGVYTHEVIVEIRQYKRKAGLWFWFYPVSLYANIRAGILISSIRQVDNKKTWSTWVICTALIPIIPVAQILTSIYLAKVRDLLTYGK